MSDGPEKIKEYPIDMAYEAGCLIALGLNPKARPARDVEYRRLLERYQKDIDFRVCIEKFASGLGLRLLDAGDYGLVLGAEETSVFTFTLERYRKRLTAEERLVHGLIHLASASYLYPNAKELEEEESVIRKISVNKLETYIRGMCKELQDRYPQTPDPLEEAPMMEQAWRLFLRYPSSREGETRRSLYTTTGMISYAFDVLEMHGMFRKESEDDGGTYQALRRYRVQVRELAAHEGYKELTELAKEISNIVANTVNTTVSPNVTVSPDNNSVSPGV